ncbi:hypothetical protein QN277_015580 [Acacia crassicarpa]|uniref:Uncharacterized protein n=1 Tax=Acacia crassicarpa TaxID=499986 RepID=A0AAE1K044_9FABA|nr:hypothetical protein QN277_015580 [Acacia crassicarpa]
MRPSLSLSPHPSGETKIKSCPFSRRNQSGKAKETEAVGFRVSLSGISGRILRRGGRRIIRRKRRRRWRQQQLQYHFLRRRLSSILVNDRTGDVVYLDGGLHGLGRGGSGGCDFLWCQ